MIRNLFFYLIVILFFVACSPKPIAFDSPLLGKSVAVLYKNRGEPARKEKATNGEKWIYVQKTEYFGKKPPKEGQPPKYVIYIERIFSINAQGVIYKYEVLKYKTKPKKK